MNHASVACKGNGLFAEERTTPMTDAHENTLFLLFNETAAKKLSLLQLRTLTAIALATPPPGISDRHTSKTRGCILALPLSPEMLSFIERSPLPAVLFCGASLESLAELAQYVENGISSIIVEVRVHDLSFCNCRSLGCQLALQIAEGGFHTLQYQFL